MRGVKTARERLFDLLAYLTLEKFGGSELNGCFGYTAENVCFIAPVHF